MKVYESFSQESNLNLTEGLRKYNTCKNKSKDKITGSVPKCCGNVGEATEYKCEKRNIWPLGLTNCANCNEYE